MEFIADFHIHSKYSRATSPEMDIEHIAEFAKMKGIGLVGTGDFTHSAWLSEIRKKLEPMGNGLFNYDGVSFILTTEVSNIFTKGNKSRKIHNIVFAPSLKVVDEINKALSRFGNLEIDGRPILSFFASRLVELVRKISPECMVIPAHIWTPHYSLFGANSGFDSVDECFEEQSKYIFALETGLSSNPQMNWRLSSLDRFSLVSNSDAHSPAKLGREANVFNCEMGYNNILEILKKKEREKFLYTIEFFPEEGKYHYDGHRACDVRLSPKESSTNGNLCPVCQKRITVGVMHRVESLADRDEGYTPELNIPYRSIVPLDEIISEALGVGVGSESVVNQYRRLVSGLQNEFYVLLKATKEEIADISGSKIAEGIMRMRKGRIKILPGFDGVFGKISVFEKEEETEEPQMTLF